MAKILYIDPGHGGTDSGARLGTRLEKNDNLKMALRIQYFLEENTDIVVRLARTKDVYKDLYARPKEAIALGVTAILSLHRNAYDGRAKGTEIWIRRYPSGLELEFAEIIMGRLASVGTTANRGIKKGRFVVLENSLNIPAIMVENLFIDNPTDNKMFDERFEAYAETIAKGTAQFFQTAYAENEKPKEYVRVQLGAFEFSEGGEFRARELIKELNDKGYSAWLVRPDNPDHVKD